MAMKNSTIDKFAARQGCPDGQVPDGKGGCAYPVYKMRKDNRGIERRGTSTNPNATDSSYQALTGYKVTPDPNFGVVYQKPKTKAEKLKNIEDAKAGKYYKRN
jgi:hypothetical protein